MNHPSPVNKPTLKTRVGPNWRLIRNLFIIAGLLVAISFVWEIRREVRSRREKQNRETIERQKQAREKALAEGREKAEAEARAIREARIHEAELAASNIDRKPDFHSSSSRQPVENPDEAVDSLNSGGRIKPQPEIPEPELPPEIVTLNTKARDLVISAGHKRDEQLAENTRKLTRDLDLYVRTLPKSEQTYWLPSINRIKNLIGKNRVPAAILQSDDVEFSKKMEELINFAATKQKQIDQGFIAESAKIHSAYLRKISEAAEQAESGGQKPLADFIKKIISKAANLEPWIKSLGIDE